MNWFTALALGFSLETRKQTKKRQERADTVSAYRSELSDAALTLSSLLSDLAFSQTLTMEQQELTALEELAPLFPMAEILSMQGYIGSEQRLFLQDYFNLTHSRYHLGQFTDSVIYRAGAYPEWYALAGLEQTHCGQIWHTFIELICRQRDPETMQRVVDLLGRILYNFWLLECANIIPAQTRWQTIISNLNRYAESDQKLPYLHAVMLLQSELAKKYAGLEADFLPQLDPESVSDMDGAVGLHFSVYRKDDPKFIHFYAVRQRTSPGEPDLIWELPAGGGAPVVFFSE